MTPVSDSALDAMHATATGIFTGAIKACNIASAFDRRIRFEGNTLHRLLPDGSGPRRIDLAAYKRIFVIALGKAAGPMLEVSARPHEATPGAARHLLLQPVASKPQLAFPLLRGRPSLAQRGLFRRAPAPRWPCSKKRRRIR